MDLKARLINTPPRDLSGANASDRFAYQRTWALCHLLDLHLAKSDYVVIFDHHEDVAVLDTEEHPTSIRGYQVKTKNDGNFTIKALLKREVGDGDPPKPLPSILGKLYDLKIRFPEEVELLAVISNAPFSVKLKSDGKTRRDQNSTKFTDLHEDYQKQILEGLAAELMHDGLITLDGVLEFTRSEIPLRDHHTHARGKLAEFLQTLFPDREFRLFPIFRALLSEVESRNNNSEENSTYEELLRHKALSRRRFTELLDEIGISAARVELQDVSQRLNAEGCPFTFLTAIRGEWDAVQLDRLARRDIPYLRLREAVKLAIQTHMSQPSLMTLIEICYKDVVPNLRREWDFSEAYVKTCIAQEAYEHQ